MELAILAYRIMIYLVQSQQDIWIHRIVPETESIQLTKNYKIEGSYVS